MILGQDLIINMINSRTIDTFPHSLMIVGEYGGGKHLISYYIAEKLGLTVKDITGNISLDTVNTIYSQVEPFIYLIDCSKMSVREQNVILKLLEEPLKNAFLILLCQNTTGMLNTVLNRCQIWELKKYPKDIIAIFVTDDTNKEYILNVAKTPGQAKIMSGGNLPDIFNLCQKMMDKMGKASLPNALSISDKIAFKNEKDKIDVFIFTQVLLQTAFEKYRDSKNKIFSKVYFLTKDYVYNNNLANVNQKYLLENYIISLRNILRSSDNENRAT